MFRFNVNIMPFAKFLSEQKLFSYNINHFFFSAELENIDSISFYYDGTKPNVTLEQLRYFISNTNKFVSVYTPLNSDSYLELLELNPNMILFCESIDPVTSEFKAVVDDSIDTLKSIIEEVTSFHIRCGLVLNPQVKTVKQVSKYPVDYIHFDLSQINSAGDIDDEMVLTESLNMAMIAAEKCNFGIMAGGKINLDSLSLFLSDERIEEFVSGFNLFEQSIIHGYTHSIQKYLNILKKR